MTIAIDGLKERAQIFLITSFFGLVAFAFMEGIQDFLTGMMWLVAAIIGVALSEALNRAHIRKPRGMLLPFAILGTLAGGILAHTLGLLATGHAVEFGIGLIPMPIELIIICAAIGFRFKT